MIPYLVCQFSKPTVSNLVKECFGSDFPDIFRKPQLNYIFRYLEDLNSKSVLLEREYLDKDYLEDFSRYYVKCFKNGGHKCARLHFFTSEIDHTSFNEILKFGTSHQAYQSLQDSYLGFIVIKPLTKTFIGKTCLKLYPSLTNLDSNKKCLSKEYLVNLFGIDLIVNSIAFQEQDRVVSACATTALWVALHGSQEKSVKQIPACSEITTNAINHIDGSNNSFPNKGLTNKQILRALDVEGMKYHNEPIDTVNATDLLEMITYHIDSNIPLILGVDILSGDQSLGGHAITILGYGKENNNYAFYVHDDRLGPFAKAQIRETDGKPYLELKRKDDFGGWQEATEIMRPSSLITPTHKKVRISYKLPKNTCRLIIEEYEKCLSILYENKLISDSTNYYTFSLKLYTISEIKKEILKHKYIDHNKHGSINEALESKARFLTHSYARFQWVANFKFQGNEAFKIFFDATDIPQGEAVSGIYIDNQENAEFLLVILRKYAESNDYSYDSKFESFFGSLLKHFKAPRPNYLEHLQKTYGELRAPKYLKESEVVDGTISSNNSVKLFYEAIDDSLDILFPTIESPDYLIWAISRDGTLIIGEEIGGKGHPTLTGFKPARIAGELKKQSGRWIINAKSGRYSRDYPNADQLLKNALQRFKGVFYASRDVLDIEETIA